MSKRKKVFKIIILLCLIILCLALTWFVIIPFIKYLSTDEGRIYIQQKVESFGIFAPLLFILLEITQIILALIPGGPVEMIGGVLFGAIGGLVLCEIGIFLATVIIYNLVKKFINRKREKRNVPESLGKSSQNRDRRRKSGKYNR